MTSTAEPAAGQAIDGAIAVDDPSTGAIIDHVPDMAAEVPSLVARAKAAQSAWEARGFDGRAEAMDAWRRWLVANRREIATTAMRESGAIYEEALFSEVFLTAAGMKFWARRSAGLLREERVPARNPFVLGRKVVVRYRPLGVVGVIAPWNFPILLGVGDTLPALMAGNSVVIKPSELTPLTTRMVAAGAHASGIPEDVFICATGDGRAGAALVDHVDMIMFTGSTATGRRVAARAGERLVPCSLELGGKDPMIVCADADLDRAAGGAVQWGLSRSGQVCMSVERIYVEAPAYEPFLAKLTERVSALRQGTPGEGGSTDVGAMTMPRQMALVAAHVEDAREKGARVLTGGGALDREGRFFAPTVLADVDHSMDCMVDETFGPTLPVMKVADSEEAVRLANDTTYGLSASVWTKDLARGEALARRIHAGTACVNDANIMFAAREAPFGGARESGVGTRHGAAGIRKYCEPQTILVTRFGPKHDLNWLPANRRVTRVFEAGLSRYYGR
jgi:acyl-CoA reductase-like NAD-dependent aldehyde dehydrogenase